MVYSKNVAFKVNKQTPAGGPPPEAYGTVINCRKPGSMRARRRKREMVSQQVRLTKVLGEKPRGDDAGAGTGSDRTALADGTSGTSTAPVAPSKDRRLPSRPQVKSTRFRKGVPLSKGLDLDCWFTVLTFVDPAQLLEMRSKIASCYRFLRDNPMLWKHSRDYYHGGTLPDPPSELTEFQYAHLRHGHGCMSCGTPSTRKTYWPFLRRWCRPCLQQKTIKEQDVISLIGDALGEDISIITKCLPSGILDSWGNFVGAGPAHTHSLKTVYLESDVKKLFQDYTKKKQENLAMWHVEVRSWVAQKAEVIEERREFAQKMEHWEDFTRSQKTAQYSGRKAQRREFYAARALELTPPIRVHVMEACPSYRRAIVIPKEPSMASWLQLKPKLEKEAADLAGRSRPPRRSSYRLPPMSSSGATTPSSDGMPPELPCLGMPARLQSIYSDLLDQPGSGHEFF